MKAGACECPAAGLAWQAMPCGAAQGHQQRDEDEGPGQRASGERPDAARGECTRRAALACQARHLRVPVPTSAYMQGNLLQCA